MKQCVINVGMLLFRYVSRLCVYTIFLQAFWRWLNVLKVEEEEKVVCVCVF